MLRQISGFQSASIRSQIYESELFILQGYKFRAYSGFRIRECYPKGGVQGFTWGLPNLHNGTHEWVDTPELLRP
eukprot:4420183-Pleurochrysis_carterae.AAC.2